MALIDIQPDFTKDELRELLQALCQKLDTGDLFVYFQVSRGTAIRNHSYGQTLKPNLSVYMLPWTGISSQKDLNWWPHRIIVLNFAILRRISCPMF